MIVERMTIADRRTMAPPMRPGYTGLSTSSDAGCPAGEYRDAGVCAPLKDRAYVMSDSINEQHTHPAQNRGTRGPGRGLAQSPTALLKEHHPPTARPALSPWAAFLSSRRDEYASTPTAATHSRQPAIATGDQP